MFLALKKVQMIKITPQVPPPSKPPKQNFWFSPTGSDLVSPSWKWGKAVSLQCKSYKFGLLVWLGNAYFLISHVYLFLITIPLIYHKNKSNSLESRLWGYFTSNFTVKLLHQYIRLWPWSLKQNISWQIGFQTIKFCF